MFGLCRPLGVTVRVSARFSGLQPLRGIGDQMPTVLASAGTVATISSKCGGSGGGKVMCGDFQLIFIASSAAQASEKLSLLAADDHAADSAARAPTPPPAPDLRVQMRLAACRLRRRPRCRPSLPPTPPTRPAALRRPRCRPRRRFGSVGTEQICIGERNERRVFIDRFRANQRKGRAEPFVAGEARNLFRPMLAYPTGRPLSETFTSP